MYRLLIVDDEPLIRNGMKRNIDWMSAGVDEVQAASCGEKALAMFAERSFDVLLTDINMQSMDGLTLIEEVNRLYPDTRVIVLTGYDDFEYARQCLRMRVEDFLLKPVDEDVLLSLVRKLRKRSEDEERARGTYLAQGALGRRKEEEALRSLLHRELPDDQRRSLLAPYRLSPERRVCLLLLSPSPEWDAKPLFDTAMTMTDLACKGVTFPDECGRLVALGFEDEGGADFLRSLAEKLVGEAREPALAFRDDPFPLADLPAAYDGALEELSAVNVGKSIVSRAKSYIRAHLSENLSVAQVAEALFITPNYVSKLFRKETNEGCNEYITRKRMERARQLLDDRTLPIGKVAEAVGYRDQNYFSLSFKKYLGVSPMQYRRGEGEPSSDAVSSAAGISRPDIRPDP